jgi:osmoprotectant transport system substrate-binding protein
MKEFLKIFCIVFIAVGLLFSAADAAKQVTVGSKNFTEQYVVGNLISMLLKENGFSVKEVFGVGSKIARDGLLTGQTDLYAEYTGTAWLNYLNHSEKSTDPVELYEQVKQEDLDKNTIVWLDRFPLNNTYALAVKQEKIETYGASISQLAEYVNAHPGEVTFGSNHEFFERPDGFFGMAEAYNMNIDKKNVIVMDTGLTYEAIAQEDVDVAMVFATDGKLKKFGLQVLQDDAQFFPVYNLCVNVRKDILEQYPEIETILKPLAELLDNDTMQNLNYRVDGEEIPAKIVAKEFLEEHELIK